MKYNILLSNDLLLFIFANYEARHCHQESEKGEGVEVVKYEPCEDENYGIGHYTEKRIHLYK